MERRGNRQRIRMIMRRGRNPVRGRSLGEMLALVPGVVLLLVAQLVLVEVFVVMRLNLKGTGADLENETEMKVILTRLKVGLRGLDIGQRAVLLTVSVAGVVVIVRVRKK